MGTRTHSVRHLEGRGNYIADSIVQGALQLIAVVVVLDDNYHWVTPGSPPKYYAVLYNRVLSIELSH